MMTELVRCWALLYEDGDSQDEIINKMEETEKYRLQYMKDFKKTAEHVVKKMHSMKE